MQILVSVNSIMFLTGKKSSKLALVEVWRKVILPVINTPKAISGHSDKPELYLKDCEGSF